MVNDEIVNALKSISHETVTRKEEIGCEKQN